MQMMMQMPQAMVMQQQVPPQQNQNPNQPNNGGNNQQQQANQPGNNSSQQKASGSSGDGTNQPNNTNQQQQNQQANVTNQQFPMRQTQQMQMPAGMFVVQGPNGPMMVNTQQMQHAPGQQMMYMPAQMQMQGAGAGAGNMNMPYVMMPGGQMNLRPMQMNMNQMNMANQMGQMGQMQQNQNMVGAAGGNQQGFPNQNSPQPHRKNQMSFDPSWNGLTMDEQLAKQLEYYFSDENLEKDEYLRAQMQSEGWVSIAHIANFKRMRQIGSMGGSMHGVTIDYIADVARNTQTLEVDEHGANIRKAGDWHKFTPTVQPAMGGDQQN